MKCSITKVENITKEIHQSEILFYKSNKREISLWQRNLTLKKAKSTPDLTNYCLNPVLTALK